ncbi:MAG: S8 family peptidase [Bacteroidota bacterium]
MRYFYLLFSAIIFSSAVFAQTQGDLLRQETKLDQVYSQYNLSGQGVIVAMIERGIDYKHPDFIDENGNTRIAYIFDMVDPSGANDPNNTYGVGTIYSEAQINQALSSGNQLSVMDAHGHGTASTGIAAGDGSGVAGAPYRGVAHKATLIAVELTNDPFPAGSGQAGQAGFFDPTYIPIALQFVKDKAAELGLPSVSLINLGSIGGPTDGTSDISQAIDAFVGPGRLLVCGVGDDGGGDNRGELTLGQGMNDSLVVYKGVAGNLRFEAWYPGADRMGVTVIRPDGSNSGALPTPASNSGVTQLFPAGFNYYHRGADVDFSSSTNGKRQILIDITGDTGTYIIHLTGETISDGFLSASLNPSTYAWNNEFRNHVVVGKSINDYASSLKAIVPTDYVYSNTYTDIDGVARARTGEGDPGEIWVGSSAGPTLDGRIGVDVAVPGEVNFGAYSAGTYYHRFRFLQIQGGNGLYGVQNAVSGSAPVLTGTLALMLEVNDSLTTQEAKDILHQSARTDAFTGTVPNGTWGHGKLDALAAIQATQNTLGLEPVAFEDWGISIFPNPTDGLIQYTWESYAGQQAHLTVLDLQGRIVFTTSLRQGAGQVSLENLPAGVYVLKISQQAGIAVQRLMIR